jgi:hypothetical protein
LAFAFDAIGDGFHVDFELLRVVGLQESPFDHVNPVEFIGVGVEVVLVDDEQVVLRGVSLFEH